jgi:hypothetical protein
VTFEASGVVVLSFLPQIASDLNAEELPSYHRNIDMDEVMLAHADDPKGRRSGSFSFTPQGVLHGADEDIARVRANDGVIPRPFPERGRPAPTSPSVAGTRHSRTLGRVPQLSFGATAPVQRRAFRARLGQLGQSSPASAGRKRSGSA